MTFPGEAVSGRRFPSRLLEDVERDMEQVFTGIVSYLVERQKNQLKH